MEISQVKMYCIESLPEIKSGIELQKLSPTFIIYSVFQKCCEALPSWAQIMPNLTPITTHCSQHTIRYLKYQSNMLRWTLVLSYILLLGVR